MRMTKHSITGAYVVTSDAINAQVYEVQEQHAVNKAMYLLVYQTARGKVSAGWCDISLMKSATGDQIREYQGFAYENN